MAEIASKDWLNYRKEMIMALELVSLHFQTINNGLQDEFLNEEDLSKDEFYIKLIVCLKQMKVFNHFVDCELANNALNCTYLQNQKFYNFISIEVNKWHTSFKVIIQEYERSNFILTDFYSYNILMPLEENIYNIIIITGNYFDTRNDVLRVNFIDSETKIIQTNTGKIKWLGNASHLGYIIYQLADKGFIEYPLHIGEVNYTGLAERLLNAFEFKDKTPPKKYLSEQINPDSENNKLSNANKLKLKLNIPNLQDLT